MTIIYVQPLTSEHAMELLESRGWIVGLAVEFLVIGFVWFLITLISLIGMKFAWYYAVGTAVVVVVTLFFLHVCVTSLSSWQPKSKGQ